MMIASGWLRMMSFMELICDVGAEVGASASL